MVRRNDKTKGPKMGLSTHYLDKNHACQACESLEPRERSAVTSALEAAHTIIEANGNKLDVSRVAETAIKSSLAAAGKKDHLNHHGFLHRRSGAHKYDKHQINDLTHLVCSLAFNGVNKLPPIDVSNKAKYDPNIHLLEICTETRRRNPPDSIGEKSLRTSEPLSDAHLMEIYTQTKKENLQPINNENQNENELATDRYTPDSSSSSGNIMNSAVPKNNKENKLPLCKLEPSSSLEDSTTSSASPEGNTKDMAKGAEDASVASNPNIIPPKESPISPSEPNNVYSEIRSASPKEVEVIHCGQFELLVM